jgi:hypothetical protein
LNESGGRRDVDDLCERGTLSRGNALNEGGGCGDIAGFCERGTGRNGAARNTLADAQEVEGRICILKGKAMLESNF